MSVTTYIINGPNLNLLGQREPDIYGHETIADVTQSCEKLGKDLNIDVVAMQSNHEGQIIDWIHKARDAVQAIIINPGAYTHTSIAILDALNAFDGIVIEVHLSQVHKREAFRHHSYVSLRADGVIAGFGTEGYTLAMRRIASLLVN